ncbi:MAG: hypothetical protein ACLTEX_01425 [Eggerthella lenta]
MAPRGYLLDETVHVRHVTDADTDGEIIETFDAEQNGDLVTDRVARTDLRFMKRADGAAKLAGIPFKLTRRRPANGTSSSRTRTACFHRIYPGPSPRREHERQRRAVHRS